MSWSVCEGTRGVSWVIAWVVPGALSFVIVASLEPPVWQSRLRGPAIHDAAMITGAILWAANSWLVSFPKRLRCRSLHHVMRDVTCSFNSLFAVPFPFLVTDGDDPWGRNFVGLHSLSERNKNFRMFWLGQRSSIFEAIRYQSFMAHGKVFA